jgi:[acyl-carrier-protein] S-malonyltransferase
VLALLAPGQGSQKPGFLSSWLELPGARERLRGWSDLIGIDLVHLGTEADAEAITDTAVTQPLLVAATLLAAEHLRLDGVDLVAGHSVGEIGAARLAGVLDADSAIQLAAVRGREMAAACAITPTGMSAVLGGDADEVRAAIEAAGAYPANINGAGQIVAAGSHEALGRFADAPPAGARVRPLSVAGAFHTPYMQPAGDNLASFAKTLNPGEPRRTWLSNADGRPMDSGAAALDRLVAQVTTSVRWDECMDAMTRRGVTAVIELPPAGTLAGLAKRAMSGVEIVKLNSPDDLDAARDLINRHNPEGQE